MQKSILNSIVLTLLMACDYSQAQVLENVKSILRPVFEVGPEVAFKFSYQLIPGNPQKPTILFFHGGPGGPIIGQDLSFLPKDYPVIVFDPRGTGLSALPTTEPGSSSSYQIAEDVAAIIKNEKIDNYIVWASSYGTVPATIFSSTTLNSKFKIHKPIAVILEGVVGRAFRYDIVTGIHEVSLGYRRSLKLLEDQLSVDEKKLFVTKIKRLGISQDDTNMLFLAVLSQGIGSSLDFIQKFIAESDPASLEKIKNIKEGKAAFAKMKVGQEFTQQMKIIGCNEIIDGSQGWSKGFGFSIFEKQLFFENSYPECVQAPLKRNSYDSANYQISNSIPIFYFVANDDPNTPAFQAEYHIQNQRNKNPLTSLYKVSTGGHFPLQGDPLTTCKDRFFTSLSGQDFRQASQELERCL